jgi:DinB family protein
MSELERIGDQLKRALEGPAWHGPALLEVLDGVTAAQACRRPLADAHSIWEIVLHVRVWEDVVRRRALAEKVAITPEQDWPKIADTRAAAWRRAVAALVTSNRALREVVGSFDEGRLDQPLVPRGNTAYVQFHGAVQHDLYHAGQIAVLRKG